jgi:hypothetical protein
MPALSPWPNWTQLNDWTADGRPDENRFNNCGPESVAECLKYLTGIELPADYIKDVMYGEAYTGYTNIPPIVDFLQKKCAVPCEVYSDDLASAMGGRSTGSTPAHTRLQPVVQQALDAGHPIIVLFFWKLEEPNSGHFCPIVACDEHGCTRSNVWNGQMETWSWDTFEQWQKLGSAIELKRLRAPDLGAGMRGLLGDPLMQRMLAMQAEARAYLERSRGRDRTPVAAESPREPAFSLVAWLRSLEDQAS